MSQLLFGFGKKSALGRVGQSAGCQRDETSFGEESQMVGLVWQYERQRITEDGEDGMR
jgi:hypothetical protein